MDQLMDQIINGPIDRSINQSTHCEAKWLSGIVVRSRTNVSSPTTSAVE